MCRCRVLVVGNRHACHTQWRDANDFVSLIVVADRGEYRQITVNFREDLLGSDAVRLWDDSQGLRNLAMISMWNCLNTSCIRSCGANATCAGICKFKKGGFGAFDPCSTGTVANTLGPAGNGYYGGSSNRMTSGPPLSPLEVQYNHTVWMPVSINAQFGHQGGAPFNLGCHPHGEPPHVQPACTNWSRADGWNFMTAVRTPWPS